MTLALDLPPCSSSPMHRLDPRWKLAALVVAAASASAVATLPAAALFFVGSLLFAGLGRLSPGWYLRQLAPLVLLLFLFALLLSFGFSEGDSFFRIGPLRLSGHGLQLAGLLALKALTIVTLMLVLLATAPLDATLKAAHSLHVPGLLIQLSVLTYRYIFLLGDELARLLIALRVRGYRLRPRRQRLHMLGLLTGTMLVRGYERGERVGQAMRCRGFDRHYRSLAEFQSRPADVLGFLAIVAGAGGLLTWDFFFRSW